MNKTKAKNEVEKRMTPNQIKQALNDIPYDETVGSHIWHEAMAKMNHELCERYGYCKSCSGTGKMVMHTMMEGFGFINCFTCKGSGKNVADKSPSAT